MAKRGEIHLQNFFYSYYDRSCIFTVIIVDHFTRSNINQLNLTSQGSVKFFLKLKLSWQICLIFLSNLPKSVKIKNPLNLNFHFEMS